MKEKSFNSEVMKNSLPTATENIMNCGMHRRNIIQRKISKMPLAQIFFVGTGGISSIYHIKLYFLILHNDLYTQ